MDDWLAEKPTLDVLYCYIDASFANDGILWVCALNELLFREDLEETLRTIEGDLSELNDLRPWALVTLYVIIDMRKREENPFLAIKRLDEIKNLENAIRFIASNKLPSQSLSPEDVDAIANNLRFFYECYFMPA